MININRILLVYPSPSQESPQKTPPLSILYVGAYCARRGYIIDYFDERWDNDFDIKLKNADVVGVSAMSGYQLQRALFYLKKSYDSGKITIIGGVHSTISPESCVNEPYIDYIVIGEGEKTFYELLNNLEQPDNVLGVWTKKGHTEQRNSLASEEIESPIDEQTLRYFRLASQSNDVMLPASRGCPYSCGFCVNSTINKKWKPIPLQNWIKDLDYLLDREIKIHFLQIGDDWIGGDKRMLEIGKELKKRNIHWHPSLRITQVTKRLMENLKIQNCVGVSIGIETGSPDILKLINKQITIENILAGAKILADCNIKPLYYFILGFPQETQEQKLETMDLADTLYNIHKGNCSIVFYGYNPQKGTNLYELAKKSGIKVPLTLKEWSTHDRSNTSEPILNYIYYIAGLTFHRTKGDKTDKNFPGVKRLLIFPFEIICALRWKLRFFKWFYLESIFIKRLLSWAAKKN